MLKAICRLKHNNPDLYTKPKMFDRWRMYVHMRKLYRYWLSYAAKRRQHITSDLAKYFDRWKNYDIRQKEQLRKLNKKDLDLRMIRNA
jgi:hypothetical protein